MENSTPIRLGRWATYGSAVVIVVGLSVLLALAVHRHMVEPAVTKRMAMVTAALLGGISLLVLWFDAGRYEREFPKNWVFEPRPVAMSLKLVVAGWATVIAMACGVCLPEVDEKVPPGGAETTARR